MIKEAVDPRRTVFVAFLSVAECSESLATVDDANVGSTVSALTVIIFFVHTQRSHVDSALAHPRGSYPCNYRLQRYALDADATTMLGALAPILCENGP